MKTAVVAPRLERWLRPPDTSTNFIHARKECHEGSGQWFLDSTAFKEWKHGSRRQLWLHGLAGCGKTVLSTTVVDHLRKMKDCVTLEFYFDFSDIAKQKIDGVLRSLVFQLYKLGFHPKDLDRLYESHLDGERQPDTATLTNCFYSMMKGLKTTTYIILDALDECIERKELLQWMKELFTMPDLSHIHLIATSRPEEEFLNRIPGWLGKERCLSLDKKAVDADIRSYVTATLKQNSDFVDKRLSQDLLEWISNKVGDGADGM
jgi:Cdc6-like AAA superfamily ATPase